MCKTSEYVKRTRTIRIRSQERDCPGFRSRTFGHTEALLKTGADLQRASSQRQFLSIAPTRRV